MSDCLRFYRKDEAKSAQYGEKVYAEVCLPVEAFNAALEHYGFVKERTCTMSPSDYYPCAEDGCTRLSIRMWTCSECEADNFGIKPNFCSYCGAKVIGGKNGVN